MTYTSAKQLVPIANKPVLFYYGIEAMAEAGINDIGIVVGDTQAEIRAAVDVRIYREPVKPSAFRFMLGDNSEVGIRW